MAGEMETMDHLLERLGVLEGVVSRSEARRQALEERQRATERRLRRWQGLTCSLLLLGLLMLPLCPGDAQGGGIAHRIDWLENRVNGLEGKIVWIDPLVQLFLRPNPVNGEPYVQRVGNQLTITGANLCIRNGLGATNGNPAHPGALLPEETAVNGLGNLIVGYNEPRAALDSSDPDERTGSHNIIVGAGQNLSSFGGFVVGQLNTINGPYASISGGAWNTASDQFASVSGGTYNRASGQGASVSGGQENRARGYLSSVSGGVSNTASGTDASVSGGYCNIAAGDGSSVSGGSAVVQPFRMGWSAGGDYFPNVWIGVFHAP
jgi:hypothetical protein